VAQTPARRVRSFGKDAAARRAFVIAGKGKEMCTKRIWLLLAIIAVLGPATLVSACGGSGSSASSADVEFLSPRDFSVAHYAGAPLVVNYFGSWCGPCNLEAPAFATFAKTHSDSASIIGIAVNDQQSDVIDFMAEYRLAYPVVLDDNSLGAKDGITGVPTTIFYDASGQEVDRIVGVASLEQFTMSFAKTQ
jgi:thiol-disulfide isomerase/thioredoxin